MNKNMKKVEKLLKEETMRTGVNPLSKFLGKNKKKSLPVLKVKVKVKL